MMTTTTIDNSRGQYGRRAIVGAEDQAVRVEVPGLAVEVRGAHVVDRVVAAAILVVAIGAGALIVGGSRAWCMALPVRDRRDRASTKRRRGRRDPTEIARGPWIVSQLTEDRFCDRIHMK
jgi:hypothetical protein